MSSTEVTIEVKLLNVASTRVDQEGLMRDEIMLNFDVNAKLEEVERRNGEAVFNFAIEINTKPSVAKFDMNGMVTVSGESDALEKILQTDPGTKVPFLLKRVYQQIFPSVFLLSGIINAPHPPPDLMFSSVKSELL